MREAINMKSKPRSPIETFHTVAEVAEALRVSSRTVRRWIADGDLVARRLGGAVRIADSNRRIFETLPGGGLSRGFFVWNSEVGAASFGIQTFFYEYVWFLQKTLQRLGTSSTPLIRS
jgi:excisionase family DNA binding protein